MGSVFGINGLIEIWIWNEFTLVSVPWRGCKNTELHGTIIRKWSSIKGVNGKS